MCPEKLTLEHTVVGRGVAAVVGPGVTVGADVGVPVGTPEGAGDVGVPVGTPEGAGDVVGALDPAQAGQLISYHATWEEINPSPWPRRHPPFDDEASAGVEGQPATLVVPHASALTLGPTFRQGDPSARGECVHRGR